MPVAFAAALTSVVAAAAAAAAVGRQRQAEQAAGQAWQSRTTVETSLPGRCMTPTTRHPAG